MISEKLLSVINTNKEILKALNALKLSDPNAYACHLSHFARLLFFNQAIFLQLTQLIEFIFAQDLNVVERGYYQLEILLKKMTSQKCLIPILQTPGRDYISKYFYEVTISTLKLWNNTRIVFASQRKKWKSEGTWIPPEMRRNAAHVRPENESELLSAEPLSNSLAQLKIDPSKSFASTQPFHENIQNKNFSKTFSASTPPKMGTTNTDVSSPKNLNTKNEYAYSDLKSTNLSSPKNPNTKNEYAYSDLSNLKSTNLSSHKNPNTKNEYAYSDLSNLKPTLNDNTYEQKKKKLSPNKNSEKEEPTYEQFIPKPSPNKGDFLSNSMKSTSSSLSSQKQDESEYSFFPALNERPKPNTLPSSYEDRKQVNNSINNNNSKNEEFLDTNSVVENFGPSFEENLTTIETLLSTPLVENSIETQKLIQHEEQRKHFQNLIDQSITLLFGKSENTYDFTPSDVYSLSPSNLNHTAENLYELTPSQVVNPNALKFGSHRLTGSSHSSGQRSTFNSTGKSNSFEAERKDTNNNEKKRTGLQMFKRPQALRIPNYDDSNNNSNISSSPKTIQDIKISPPSQSENFCPIKQKQTSFLPKDQRTASRGSIPSEEATSGNITPHEYWKKLSYEDKKIRLRYYCREKILIMKDALPTEIRVEWENVFGHLPLIHRDSFEEFFKVHSISKHDADLILSFFKPKGKFINLWRLDDFLNSFGPVSKIGENLAQVLNHPSFCRNLCQGEANTLLKYKSTGSWIFGFDGCLSRFLFSFNQQGHVSHRYLHASPELGGFHLSQSTSTIYSSPIDFIQREAHIFQIPIPCPSFFSEDWWMGSVNSELAEYLIFLKPPGTFLVRYSSYPSSYVIQYISDSSKAEKFLVKFDGSSFIVENVSTPFPSLEATVLYFSPFLKICVADVM